MLQCWERRRGDPPVIANSKVSDAAKWTVATGSKGSTSVATRTDDAAPPAETRAVSSERQRGMRLTAARELPLIVLCTVALATAISCNAQTAPTAVLPATPPTSPEPPSNPTRPEELQWSAVGATAQCRDRTFFHGKLDQHTCSDHGGVRKMLQGRGQDLIR